MGILGAAAIHAWATQDELVADKLEQVERKRLAFLRQLFEEAKFPKSRAKETAELCYLAFLGYAFKAGRSSVFELELSLLGAKLSDLFIEEG